MDLLTYTNIRPRDHKHSKVSHILGVTMRSKSPRKNHNDTLQGFGINPRETIDGLYLFIIRFYIEPQDHLIKETKNHSH